MDVFVLYKDYHCFGLLKPDLRVSRDLPKGPKSPPEGPPEPLKKHSPFSAAKRTPEEPKRGPESKKGAPLAPWPPPGFRSGAQKGAGDPPGKHQKSPGGALGPPGAPNPRETRTRDPPRERFGVF